MNNKESIYIFGSGRRAKQLAGYFDSERYAAVNISEKNNNNPNQSKSANELTREFESIYNNEPVKAFISLGRGSVISGIENIAEAWNNLVIKYPLLKKSIFIGPSFESAKIFCDKLLTYNALSELNIPVARTLSANALNYKESIASFPFPAVVKVKNLSGGRGMKFVNNPEDISKTIGELSALGLYDFILTEYLQGVEITFTVLRLGKNFLRLPPSYKKETDANLIHPDAKVKIAGMYRMFDAYFESVENVMRQYNISGFFSLQGVLIKKEGRYLFNVLEAAPRMTGSTPIMEASLRGFNVYQTIANWIQYNRINFGYEQRMAIQYSTYLLDDNSKSIIEKLLRQDWIIEAKYEDLALMPFSQINKKRIRISFFIDNAAEMSEKLQLISLLVNDDNYGNDILRVLSWFQTEHSGLSASPRKILTGRWDENIAWEFYLSGFLPPRRLCSAVFCLAKYKDKVALTKTKRGWELLGGHIEKDETIEQALERESLEEGGVRIDRYKLFGYRKIITTKQIGNGREKQYPFPVSYIPYYVATSDSPPQKCFGKECLDNKLFSLDEIEKLSINSYPVIKAGLAFFRGIE